VLGRAIAAFPDRVRLVYKDFPLASHPRAVPAAEAARCAGEHGRFWEYHDLLFVGRAAFSDADLRTYAARLDVPLERFAACLASGRHRPAIAADAAEGRAAGVRGTPTFFVNGRPIVGAQPIEVFLDAIRDALAASDPGGRR
jgi:protein-disulfide isomerase